MSNEINFDKPIGDKEIPKLEAKEVIVQGKRISRKPDDETKPKKGDIVVLICKHPDSDKLIEISQVKIFKGEDNVKVVGLWYNEDDDKNIQKGSVLADMMTLFGIKTLNDFDGKTLPTVKQSEKLDYLCIKGYK